MCSSSSSYVEFHTHHRLKIESNDVNDDVTIDATTLRRRAAKYISDMASRHICEGLCPV